MYIVHNAEMYDQYFIMNTMISKYNCNENKSFLNILNIPTRSNVMLYIYIKSV